MTHDELSLLLYLESRAVDNCGAVDARHINKDDFEIAKRWAESGYVMFGRVCSADMLEGRTYWCRLSDAAWIDAHAERRARAERAWSKRAWRTTAEHREEG